jgi:UDP-N-acetylmuramate: L-alanyl-gamma-D-glutamyl-meso-diaminopimelate ligase
VRKLSAKSFAPVESFAYGSDEPAIDPARHWNAEDVAFSESGTEFVVTRGGKEWGKVTTTLAGSFNVRNTLAVIAVAESIGADREGVKEGLKTFLSVKRRMEVKGEARGVVVIDDFAHHPTAVRETIDAVKQKYAGRRIIAVFEPRSYTAQRREFQSDYEKAFVGAEEIVLGGLFHPERYTKDTAMNPAELVAAWKASGKPAAQFQEVDDLVAYLTPRLRSRDVVVVMSNGAFGGVHMKLLETLNRGTAD